MADVGVTDPFWRGRRVLVTGHTGFKGAWLSLWLERAGAVVTGLALHPPSGGAFEVLQPQLHEDVRVDIRDAVAVRHCVAGATPQVVFHLAAQALVRAGYADPATTFDTNVRGTANVLEAVDTLAERPATVVVTTDKVYDLRSGDTPRRESDPLGGADPYSASKACCELMVAAWRAARGATSRMSTARAGNVIGGGDVSPDRIVPDVVRALRVGEPVAVRNPLALRPWQHVLEPIEGYLRLAEALVLHPSDAPSAVNFGPDACSEVDVTEIVEGLIERWGEGEWRAADCLGPAEAATLRLDSTLADRALGWRPRLDLAEALTWTVDWWQALVAGDDVRARSLEQLDRYQRLVER